MRISPGMRHRRLPIFPAVSAYCPSPDFLLVVTFPPGRTMPAVEQCTFAEYTPPGEIVFASSAPSLSPARKSSSVSVSYRRTPGILAPFKRFALCLPRSPSPIPPRDYRNFSRECARRDGNLPSAPFRLPAD